VQPIQSEVYFFCSTSLLRIAQWCEIGKRVQLERKEGRVHGREGGKKKARWW